MKPILRYPGGKHYARKHLLPLVPEFKEYRETMIGGGSMFCKLKSLFPDRRFWFNDIHEDLILLYREVQRDRFHFHEGICSYRDFS